MKRYFELEYEGHVVRCGLSTKYKHYRIHVDGEPAGWLEPTTGNVYSEQAERLGCFRRTNDGLLAAAEHHIHFR